MPEEKKTEEKKPSFEEVMEMLKDPAILHAAAAKHGLKVVSPEAKKEEKKERKLPAFEIPEDADMPTLIKGLNKALGSIFTHVSETIEESKGELKGEVVKSKQEETANKVREFAKKNKDFEELIPFIEPYFNTGKYSIEEAYEMGKRASGKAVEKKEEKKSASETPPRLSKTSENDDEETTPAKPISVRDAAKKNLDKILKDLPAGEEDPLGEKDKLD